MSLYKQIDFNSSGTRLATSAANVVKIQEKNGTTWVQLGSDITDPSGIDYKYGSHINLDNDGNRIAIGSTIYDPSNNLVGVIDVFEYGTEWTQVGQRIMGEISPDPYFYSSTFNSDASKIMIVGQGEYDNDLEVGRVRVYDFSLGTSRWEYAGTFVSEYKIHNAVLDMTRITNNEEDIQNLDDNVQFLGGRVTDLSNEVTGFDGTLKIQNIYFTDISFSFNAFMDEFEDVSGILRDLSSSTFDRFENTNGVLADLSDNMPIRKIDNTTYQFDLSSIIMNSTDIDMSGHTGVIYAGEKVVLQNHSLENYDKEYMYSTNPFKIAEAGEKYTADYEFSVIVLPTQDILKLGTGTMLYKSADFGNSWIQMPDLPFNMGIGGQSAVVCSDGTIVVFVPGVHNSVWNSTDGGNTWREVCTENQLPMNKTNRTYHNMHVLPNDEIVLIGGIYGDTFNLLNDVWISTDKGATWHIQTLNANWQKRHHFNSIVLGNKIYVIAGMGQDSTRPLNDVWVSTDKGKQWTLITNNAEFGPRSDACLSITKDGNLLIVGGYSNTDTELEYKQDGYYFDAWSSADGKLWVNLVSTNGMITNHGIIGSKMVSVNESCVLLTGKYIDQNYLNYGDPNVGPDNTNRVYCTDNDGHNWHELVYGKPNNNSPFKNGAQLSKLNNGNLIAISGMDPETNQPTNRVFLSDDGGNNWSHISSVGNYPLSSHSLITTKSDKLIKIGGSTQAASTIYTSVDSGYNWNIIQTVYVDDQIVGDSKFPVDGEIYSNSSTICLHDNTLLTLSNKNILYLSYDEGNKWYSRDLSANFQFDSEDTPQVIQLNNPSHSVLLHINSQIWSTDDYGLTWTQINDNITDTSYQLQRCKMIYQEQRDAIILFGGIKVFDDGQTTTTEYNQDFYVSLNYGVDWQSYTDLSNADFNFGEHPTAVDNGYDMFIVTGYDTSLNDFYRLPYSSVVPFVEQKPLLISQKINASTLMENNIPLEDKYISKYGENTIQGSLLIEDSTLNVRYKTELLDTETKLHHPPIGIQYVSHESYDNEDGLTISNATVNYTYRNSAWGVGDYQFTASTLPDPNDLDSTADFAFYNQFDTSNNRYQYSKFGVNYDKDTEEVGTGIFKSSKQYMTSTNTDYSDVGDYIQVRFPAPVKVDYYKVLTANSLDRADPYSWSVYGKNDGDQLWTRIDKTKLTTTTPSYNTYCVNPNDPGYGYSSDSFKIFDPAYYQYYRIVVHQTRVFVNDTLTDDLSVNSCSIGQWELYGASDFIGLSYPPITQTFDNSNGIVVQNQRYGNGHYKVIESDRTQITNNGYYVFDHNPSTYWITNSLTNGYERYDASGVPTQYCSDFSFGSIHEKGDWVQIILPDDIHLRSYQIHGRVSDGLENSIPVSWNVYGCNDLSYYSDITLLDQVDNVDVDTRLGLTNIHHIHSNNHYQCYFLLIRRIVPTDSSITQTPKVLTISEWKLYGIYRISELCQIPPIPLQYPFQVIKDKAYGNGMYETTSSRYEGSENQPVNVFDFNNTSNFWKSDTISDENGYLNQNAVISINGYNSPWVKLYISEYVSIHSLQIFTTEEQTTTYPIDFIVFGSNNNVSWEPLYRYNHDTEFNQNTYGNGTSESIDYLHYINSHEYYSYYMIMFIRINKPFQECRIGSIKMYGVPYNKNIIYTNPDNNDINISSIGQTSLTIGCPQQLYTLGTKLNIHGKQDQSSIISVTNEDSGNKTGILMGNLKSDTMFGLMTNENTIPTFDIAIGKPNILSHNNLTSSEITKLFTVESTTGNIGIHCPTPQYRLDIHQENYDSIIGFTSPSPYITYTQNEDVSWNVGLINPFNGHYYIESTQGNRILTSNIEKFGVNTIAPQKKMEIYDHTEPVLRLQSIENNADIGVFNTNEFKIWVNEVEEMIIKGGSHRFGFNHSNPTSKIHILSDVDTQLTIGTSDAASSSLDLHADVSYALMKHGGSSVDNIRIYPNQNTYISGNVGIGTDTPLNKLHVEVAKNTNVLNGNGDFDEDVDRGVLSIVQHEPSPEDWSYGAEYGRITMGTTEFGMAAIAAIDLREDASTNDLSGGLAFYTKHSDHSLGLKDPIARYSGLVEHMRITGDGDVGIDVQAPTEKLHVNGYLRIEDGFIQRGRLLDHISFSTPFSNQYRRLRIPVTILQENPQSYIPIWIQGQLASINENGIETDVAEIKARLYFIGSDISPNTPYVFIEHLSQTTYLKLSTQTNYISSTEYEVYLDIFTFNIYNGTDKYHILSYELYGYDILPHKASLLSISSEDWVEQTQLNGNGIALYDNKVSIGNTTTNYKFEVTGNANVTEIYEDNVYLLNKYAGVNTNTHMLFANQNYNYLFSDRTRVSYIEDEGMSIIGKSSANLLRTRVPIHSTKKYYIRMELQILNNDGNGNNMNIGVACYDSDHTLLQTDNLNVYNYALAANYLVNNSNTFILDKVIQGYNTPTTGTDIDKFDPYASFFDIVFYTRYNQPDNTDVKLLIKRLEIVAFDSIHETSDGRIGIGTITPTGNLTLNNGLNSTINMDLRGGFEDGTTTIGFNGGSNDSVGEYKNNVNKSSFLVGHNSSGITNDYFFIDNYDTTRENIVVIDNTGNVGIGLNSTMPNSKLDVSGTVTATSFSPFTGSHIVFNQPGKVWDTTDYGKIVVSTGEIPNITLNNAWPSIQLASQENDPAVYGVLSNNINNHLSVNSVGEGAIWVSDKNGDFKNGDYITTSSLHGYGQRQADDLLHNYTVAKITMDCSFDPQMIPILEYDIEDVVLSKDVSYATFMVAIPKYHDVIYKDISSVPLMEYKTIQKTVPIMVDMSMMKVVTDEIWSEEENRIVERTREVEYVTQVESGEYREIEEDIEVPVYQTVWISRDSGEKLVEGVTTKTTDQLIREGYERQVERKMREFMVTRIEKEVIYDTRDVSDTVMLRQWNDELGDYQTVEMDITRKVQDISFEWVPVQQWDNSMNSWREWTVIGTENIEKVTVAQVQGLIVGEKNEKIYQEAIDISIQSIRTETTTETVQRHKIDENGNYVWREVVDSEQIPVLKPEYEMRWIDSSGSLLSREEYDRRKSEGDMNVWRAAFVGCTYHCG